MENQKLESRPFHCPKAKLSPRSLSSSRRKRQITHSSQLRWRTMKTYFKMHCFKSTFFKTCNRRMHFLLEGWNVLLVTLSKHKVATVTEFLSLFVTVIINIYIQQHVLYLPVLNVTPITLYFFSTKTAVCLYRVHHQNEA